MYKPVQENKSTQKAHGAQVKHHLVKDINITPRKHFPNACQVKDIIKHPAQPKFLSRNLVYLVGKKTKPEYTSNSTFLKLPTLHLWTG